MYYGSKNIVEKIDINLANSMLDKNGRIQDRCIYITEQYGIIMFGLVKLTYFEQVCFARILGLNDKKEIVLDNELMLLDKNEVVRYFKG